MNSLCALIVSNLIKQPVRLIIKHYLIYLPSMSVCVRISVQERRSLRGSGVSCTRCPHSAGQCGGSMVPRGCPFYNTRKIDMN